ncbi:MAG: response regulator [Lentisphaerota bacterium]
MKKRILFVDDEPCILEMLRHMFQGMSAEWDMSFARSGQDALSVMAQMPFDVIVTDIRMPGMDGVELLNKVKKDYPRTVRFVFSSESDRDIIYRLIGSTHQFLLKPYDLNVIRETISRAFSLREILSKDSLTRVVSQIKTLPSLPDLYNQVVRELQAPTSSIDKIGAIISKDPAMSAKILQLVNSAFFGLRQHVSNPTQAAGMLGLDILKSLVLVVHIFTQQNGIEVEGFSQKILWIHSLSVSVMSQQIALEQNIEKKATDDAFIAGLFHDMGKLVLMVNLPDAYRQVLEETRAKHSSLTDTETELLGSSHAQVGAYLLGLWGFSDPIIEACAYHHVPSRCRQQSFGPLTTVHVANCLDHETQPPVTGEAPAKIDKEYMEQLGLLDRVDIWRSACGGTQKTARETYHGTRKEL